MTSFSILGGRGTVPGSEGLRSRWLLQRKPAEVQADIAGLSLRCRASKIAFSTPQHVAIDVSVEKSHSHI